MKALTLPSGVLVPSRAILPTDVPALKRFHTRLSERSIYLRFFGSLEELPEEKARYFSQVDGADHLALVALDPNEPDEIIAVVRYDREPGSEKAEYAALIEDRWQKSGVGTGLTRQLIDEARDNGVRFFYALVMGKNKGMLKLLRHLDLPETERLEHGHKHVEVELSSEGFR
ncbi:MAG TPA: GNAT family N-acetyltransferase [Rubrobacteraceae bacterium]|nr:GNAT family N-acetyltransferase [Rubrobacteraceae bacterium]